jgi:hypothetical protein
MKLIMNLMNAMNWKDTNKGRRGRKDGNFLPGNNRWRRRQIGEENCHTPSKSLILFSIPPHQSSASFENSPSSFSNSQTPILSRHLPSCPMDHN